MFNLNQATNSLKPRIIVCLDVANGRVVKGVNFKGLKDMGDPVELALQYQSQGADEIVFLDIKATLENRANALDTVIQVAKNLSIPFTVGGGLNSYQDVAEFLNAGADKVALNTAAVNNPDLIDEIAKGFGSQCVVVAIDVDIKSTGKNNKSKNSNIYEVFINGGHKKTELEAFNWIKEVESRGAGEILLTAMHRDGTGQGFDNDLMGKVVSNLSIQAIASGGAANAQHFADTFRAGSDAALAAGMFHRGEFSVADIKKELIKQGIGVRIC